MTIESNLFRKEALARRLDKNLETLSINTPLHIKFFGPVCLIILSMISLFILFANFSKKNYVKGYIDNDRGIVSVYPPYNGIISSSKIYEGMHVSKNQSLMKISELTPDALYKNSIDNISQRLSNLKKELSIKTKFKTSILEIHKKNFISTRFLNDLSGEILEIQNKIKLLEYEIINIKKNHYYEIKSPLEGIITNIQYQRGQFSDISKFLFQIVPDNSKYIARIFVPIQSVGFISKGDEILLKYDAYPSHKFGSYKAIINEINLTVLTDEVDSKPFRVGQAYYKIQAQLLKPFVQVYGKNVQLNHGMTFTAVITGEKKTIFKWILDPIYSFYGEHAK